VLTIREATLDDLDRIVELAARFIGQGPYAALLLLAPNRPHLERLVQIILEHGVVLVGEVDGTIEGMLALTALPHPTTGEPFGDELAWWVNPEVRASRLGPRLLQAAETWCQARGLPWLKMIAPAGTSVGRYYERHGYAPLETAYLKRLA
jgi:GNAT superfamily N-acetyltransferase